MSTHNICFGGEIRKTSVHFGWKKCLIWAMDLLFANFAISILPCLP